MKTSVKSVYTKAQKEVLDAIDGKKPLPVPGKSRHGNLLRYRRHDDAVNELKKLGVITTVMGGLVRVAQPKQDSGPLFTSNELTVIGYALNQYSTAFAGNTDMWKMISELRRKVILLSQTGR